MLLGKVFSVNTVLFGQKEDRTYKTQNPTVEGRKPLAAPMNQNVHQIQIWIKCGSQI